MERKVVHERDPNLCRQIIGEEQSHASLACVYINLFVITYKSVGAYHIKILQGLHLKKYGDHFFQRKNSIFTSRACSCSCSETAPPLVTILALLENSRFKISTSEIYWVGGSADYVAYGKTHKSNHCIKLYVKKALVVSPFNRN